MVLESITFALGLWAISRVLAPLMLQAGIDLNTTPAPTEQAPPAVSAAEPGLRQVVTYLGGFRTLYVCVAAVVLLGSASVGQIRSVP